MVPALQAWSLLLSILFLHPGFRAFKCLAPDHPTHKRQLRESQPGVRPTPELGPSWTRQVVKTDFLLSGKQEVSALILQNCKLSTERVLRRLLRRIKVGTVDLSKCRGWEHRLCPGIWQTQKACLRFPWLLGLGAMQRQN